MYALATLPAPTDGTLVNPSCVDELQRLRAMSLDDTLTEPDTTNLAEILSTCCIVRYRGL